MSRRFEFGAEVLLRSQDSDEAIGVMENAAPGRWQGPPLHRHDFDEAFYVLEGELTFQLGDELRSARAGELVFAPRGAEHTFANRSEDPARYLLICTPAGFERTLAQRAARRAGEEPPEWARAAGPAVEVTGPPIEL